MLYPLYRVDNNEIEFDLNIESLVENKNVFNKQRCSLKVKFSSILLIRFQNPQ